MNYRMDKYENDTPDFNKRTERNKNLYHSYEVEDYTKFDVNSNVEVLKNNARSINVDQIREMLDKKYRDNIPKRKSIALDSTVEEIVDEKEDTKEYDLNSILTKAKSEKSIDYEVERLNRTYNNMNLVDEINRKYKTNEYEETDEEKELVELINTITALELKNQKSNAELLNMLDDEENEEESANTLVKESLLSEKEEEFYTGNLVVTEQDFEDFKDMKDDIKSNSLLIKVLVFIFIVLALGVGIVIANNMFNLGLF